MDPAAVGLCCGTVGLQGAPDHPSAKCCIFSFWLFSGVPWIGATSGADFEFLTCVSALQQALAHIVIPICGRRCRTFELTNAWQLKFGSLQAEDGERCQGEGT